MRELDVCYPPQKTSEPWWNAYHLPPGIELMLLVGLFTILGWACVMCVESTDAPEDPHRTAAERNLLDLQSSLLLYESENDAWPETLQALTRESPRGFAPCRPDIPMDPWGRTLSYTRNNTRITLASAGKDGLLHTLDDVSLVFDAD